jgi:hypothetical protein
MRPDFIKKIFFSLSITIIFFLFSFSGILAQVNQPNAGFGEGIVTINEYAFAPNDLAALDPLSILHRERFYNYTYYIKGNKILRNDQYDSTLNIGSSTSETVGIHGEVIKTFLKAKMVHPIYMIDWNKRTVYTFLKKKEDIQVSEKGLKNETSEFFYRMIDSNKTSTKIIINSLEKNNPVIIAQKKCFKGSITGITGDKFPFYCSMDPVKVHSPLNGFLPADFPYNVMRVDMLIDWTIDEGKLSKGILVFQVAEITERNLADSLFDIPD